MWRIIWQRNKAEVIDFAKKTVWIWQSRSTARKCTIVYLTGLAPSFVISLRFNFEYAQPRPCFRDTPLIISCYFFTFTPNIPFDSTQLQTLTLACNSNDLLTLNVNQVLLTQLNPIQ
jgi:hypothetical protein